MKSSKQVQVMINLSDGTLLTYKEYYKKVKDLPKAYSLALKEQIALSVSIEGVNHTFNPSSIVKISIEEE